jgi:hypothetical protein
MVRPTAPHPSTTRRDPAYIHPLHRQAHASVQNDRSNEVPSKNTSRSSRGKQARVREQSGCLKRPEYVPPLTRVIHKEGNNESQKAARWVALGGHEAHRRIASPTTVSHLRRHVVVQDGQVHHPRRCLGLARYSTNLNPRTAQAELQRQPRLCPEPWSVQPTDQHQGQRCYSNFNRTGRPNALQVSRRGID